MQKSLILPYLSFKGNVDHLSCSPFKQINSVTPGEIFNIYKPDTKISWGIELPTDYFHYSINQYYNEFREVLNHAVSKRIIGCTNVMSELSGGIDSSLVTTIAATQPNCPQHFVTLSLLYNLHKEADESLIISDFTRELNITDSVFLCGDELWLYKDFSSVQLPFFDEPTPDVGYYPIRKAFSNVAQQQKCNILLSGHGGDHAVDNTPITLYDCLLNRHFGSMHEQLKVWLRRFSSGQNMNMSTLLYNYVLIPFICSSKLPIVSSHIHSALLGTYGRSLPFLTADASKYQNTIIGNKNPYQLRKNIAPFDIQVNYLTAVHNGSLRWVNRIDEANGIRREYPYMDKALIKFLLQVPPQIKTNQAGYKQIQKMSYIDILPQCILERKQHANFTFLTYLGVIREFLFLSHTLQNGALSQLGVIDLNKTQNMLMEVRMGVALPDLCDLWGVLGYEIWYKTYSSYMQLDHGSGIFNLLHDY